MKILCHPIHFFVTVVSLASLSVVGEEFAAIKRVLPAPATHLPAREISAALLKEIGVFAPRISAVRSKHPELAADVEVFFKAARFALEIGEFWTPKDIDKVHAILAEGRKRLDSLEKGDPYWTRERGAVIRGFYSVLDGSPQPYAMEIPDNLALPDPAAVGETDPVPPIWLWLHGRGDKETDLHFIAGRMGRKGQFQPDDAIVVHPLGRQCIGWKGPGEADALECADAAGRALYGPKGRPRFAMMGFSMGGAGSWQLGAHYPWKWSAVHAGAGFVDVARFTKMPPDQHPAWYVQTLWGVYNVPHYVHNLFNLPVLAYSGELDKQRDAAEFMAETFQAEGQTLRHIIGPQMPHKYDPESIKSITIFMQKALRGEERGANQANHRSLQTRTLRYNRVPLIRANGLEEHWKDSRIDLRWDGELTEASSFRIETKNISDLTIGEPDLRLKAGAKITIDDTVINPNQRDGFRFVKKDGKWELGSDPLFGSAVGIRKTPGRQGPVDDAFMEPFLVVLPDGKCSSPAVEKWVTFELQHFLQRWREVFRGEARVKKASEVTEDDIQRFHLVCWGDPASNAIIARALPDLPLRWTGSEVGVGSLIHPAATHLPIMIYPNPLKNSGGNYLVLNSGPTFRENDDRNNSQQNPKLPDWSIIDITVTPDDKVPGGIVAADFFDESWQVKKQNK